MTAEEIRQKAIECSKALIMQRCCHPCEECEYCEYFLSREVNCLTLYGYEHGFADGVKEGKKLAVNHGKWIEREVPILDDDVDIMYKCSCCGYEDGMNYKSMKYCPNCGAKMDEEGEEETT